MHIFYMLCSKDISSRQEIITLEICLNIVFEAIGNIRPTSIVINKHKTSLLAIQKIVDEDKYCWRDELVGTEQIAGRLLLCRFHVMKAWSENLLTRVPLHLKKNVWQSLYTLMHCSSEITFDYELERFYDEFKDIEGVVIYIQSGWANHGVPWRSMWPTWGRLFRYGGMDTTNHVERHWEWIKYSLLGAKVNRKLRDLVMAIIGSAADGTRVGGATLIDHFKQHQTISES